MLLRLLCVVHLYVFDCIPCCLRSELLPMCLFLSISDHFTISVHWSLDVFFVSSSFLCVVQVGLFLCFALPHHVKVRSHPERSAEHIPHLFSIRMCLLSRSFVCLLSQSFLCPPPSSSSSLGSMRYVVYPSLLTDPDSSLTCLSVSFLLFAYIMGEALPIVSAGLFKLRFDLHCEIMDTLGKAIPDTSSEVSHLCF